MTIGLFYAILAGICFAAGTVATRRGLFQAETPLGAVFITVPIGALFFTGLVIVTGEYRALWHIPWYGFAALALAGIFHFVGGRLLQYISLQLLGANRNSAIVRTSPLWAAMFGVLFLDESLSVLAIFGILLVVSGATMATVKTEEESRSLQVKGVVAGLATALCWAISALLVKSVIQEVGSPITAAFISFVSASVVLAGLFSRKQFRRQPLQLRGHLLALFVVSGILTAGAQLLRYTALKYSPMSLVEPVMSTYVLFILLFSFLINRNIELFNLRVILGVTSTVVGTVLIFL